MQMIIDTVIMRLENMITSALLPTLSIMKPKGALRNAEMRYGRKLALAAWFSVYPYFSWSIRLQMFERNGKSTQ